MFQTKIEISLEKKLKLRSYHESKSFSILIMSTSVNSLSLVVFLWIFSLVFLTGIFSIVVDRKFKYNLT